jgi:hypothetical protein
VTAEYAATEGDVRPFVGTEGGVAVAPVAGFGFGAAVGVRL